MKSYVVMLLVILGGAVISSCHKTSVPIAHNIKYIASADTFTFNVTYIDQNKQVVNETGVNNGWVKTFTISNQSGFPAKLTVSTDTGHHVVADIYVDDVKVGTSESDTGKATVLYPVP